VRSRDRSNAASQRRFANRLAPKDHPPLVLISAPSPLSSTRATSVSGTCLVQNAVVIATSPRPESSTTRNGTTKEARNAAVANAAAGTSKTCGKKNQSRRKPRPE
jgi:hypothetical protein